MNKIYIDLVLSTPGVALGLALVCVPEEPGDGELAPLDPEARGVVGLLHGTRRV